MCITAERLRVLAPNARARIITPLAPVLMALLPQQGVNTPLRRAHFIAQICIESAEFRRMSECLWYRSAAHIAAVWPRLKDRASFLARHPQALANAAYADRLGNGDEASGDGWRFRGRGLIQITGRANYAAAGGALNLPLTTEPEQALEIIPAVRIALWFWNAHGCSALADKDDARAITRAINGPAMRLAAERRTRADKALTIFISAPRKAESPHPGGHGLSWKS